MTDTYGHDEVMRALVAYGHACIDTDMIAMAAHYDFIAAHIDRQDALIAALVETGNALACTDDCDGCDIPSCPSAAWSAAVQRTEGKR